VFSSLSVTALRDRTSPLRPLVHLSMAPAMKWMAKKTTESEEKPAKGKGAGSKGQKKETKGESSKGSDRGKEKGSQSWWNDGWNDSSYDSWWNDWKSKPKKGKSEEEKGSKGKSKGKHEERESSDDKKGKGKGKGRSEKGDWPPVNGAKTVAEVEAEMAKSKIERVKRNADSGGKQPVEAKGANCQVHKHSGMGCAVVSLAAADTREAIMCYAEKTFGRSAAGKLEMDISDVKVQLKRHKDKGTGREVLTDIFVAWGHQQEKDSPLTVDEIADYFDKLYEDAMNAPPGAPGPALNSAVPGAAAMLGRGPGGPRPPPPPAMAHHMPHHPAMQPNPYYNAMYGAMMNPAMNPYMQQQIAAQQAQAQAAAYAAAYHQQMQQQQQYNMFYDAKGKWGGKGMKGGGKGKDKGVDDAAAAAAAAAAAVPPGPEVPAVPAEGEAKPEAVVAEGSDPAAAAAAATAAVQAAVPDFSPPKPRLLQIVDPSSGKPIDTIGMNFEPRKPSTPLQIKNPTTGEAVDMEAKS